MTVTILSGDCRAVLPTLASGSVHTVVTSPPYFGLRDYGVSGQIGLEPTPDEFVAEIVNIFREVRRILRDDGTVWLNLGDSYAGSGRGGYPGGKSGLDGSTAGQDSTRIARRSQVAAGFHEKVRLAGAIARAWVPPPAGLKNKDLIGIPWRVAFALQTDGWWLRQDIIWSKPNPMPESVTDRCTKAHEYIFLLSKQEKYRYDADAIAENRTSDHDECTTGVGWGNLDRQSPVVKDRGRGRIKRGRGVPPFHSKYASSDQSNLDNVGRGGKRNKRSVWTVATFPYPEAHFATFPPNLIIDCIKAGCPEGGTVLDPFGGPGTTGLVADRLGRNAVLIEINPKYAALAQKRIQGDVPLFAEVAAG